MRVYVMILSWAYGRMARVRGCSNHPWRFGVRGGTEFIRLSDILAGWGCLRGEAIANLIYRVGV
jgi:hypothetical protein